VDPQLAEFLARAGVVFLASGLRSWTRGAEIWARVLPALERSVADAGADPARLAAARAVLTDEIRASLRELVEVASHEGRRLQVEIDDVAQRLWPVPAAERSDGYWRRWTVKP
jgi:hypothetical protein